MLPQSYKFSKGLCFYHLHQVCLIGNRIYQAPQFRYINWVDEVYHLVRVIKVLGDMECLMRSVK